MGSGLAVALGPPQEVIPKLCEGANVTVAKVQVGFTQTFNSRLSDLGRLLVKVTLARR